MAFHAPDPQAPLARNERETLTPRKWAFPPTLQSTFYARVAFLAPEPQAPLARSERETLTSRKWAFPPTLQSTSYARVAFLAPEPQAPLARNERETPLENGRSRQHYKVLFMREWRSLRLICKCRSRATSCRHLYVKISVPVNSTLYYLCTSTVLYCKKLVVSSAIIIARDRSSHLQ